MIPIEDANEYQRCIYPWVYDRIEVTASRFTGPPAGPHIQAQFSRPTEPVAFCLLGTFHCEYQSGPALPALAQMASEILGGGGFFGIKTARRLRP